MQTCPIHTNFVSALRLQDDTVLLAGGSVFCGFERVSRRSGSLGRIRFSRSCSPTRPFLGFEPSRLTKTGRSSSAMRVICTFCATIRIDRLDSGTTHDLLGIVDLPTGEVLAVGDFGTVLAAGKLRALENFAPYIAASDSTTDWEALESGTDRQLWGLWHDLAQGQLYACGEEGTVLVCDRGNWELLPPVNDLGVHALNRAPDGGLLAAGQMGEVHHFDGTAWSQGLRPEDGCDYPLAVVGRNDVFCGRRRRPCPTEKPGHAELEPDGERHQERAI